MWSEKTGACFLAAECVRLRPARAMEPAHGCLQQPGGAHAMHDKAWDACCGKLGPQGSVQLQSPSRGSSLWSTQDGFVPCFDPDRATSIECVQDVAACPSYWSADLAPRSDQDCFATCTSRDAEAQDKQKAQPATANDDAASLPDNHRLCSSSEAAQPLSKAEKLRQRSCRQLEDLLAMIRNEQTSEGELCAKAGFLEQQDPAGEAITPQMIMIVSSWLSEVAYEFSMQQETLFLAVALLGRFLEASAGVPRGVLQLVAVACIMLAAKQDEVVHPSVQELTDIAANCFSAQDLLRMERILLDTLSWRLKTPTAYTFLHLFTQSTAAMRAVGGVAAAASALSMSPPAPAPPPQHIAEPLSGLVVATAAYLTELALLDPAMLGYAPSQVAASALLLAESWSVQGAAVDEMRAISGFTAADLQPCMARLVHLHHCAGVAGTCESLAPFVFVKDKYSQDCWLKASLQPAPTPAEGQAAAGHSSSGGPDSPAAQQQQHYGAAPMEA